MASCPWKGRGQLTWTIKILLDTNRSSGTAEARMVKFCMRVGYAKFQQKEDKSPSKRAWLESRDVKFRERSDNISETVQNWDKRLR